MAKDEASIVSLRGIILCCLLVTLMNFAMYTWSVKFGSQVAGGTQEKTFIFADKNGRETQWLPLALEMEQYESEGYDIGWTDGVLWTFIKKVLATYAPFFQLILLRCYGVFANVPIFLFAFMVGWTEGFVRYMEKQCDAENVSSTVFVLSIRFGVAAFVAALFFYITLPAGSDMPILGGQFPVWIETEGRVFWLTSPTLWVSVLAGVGLIVSWLASANLSREI